MLIQQKNWNITSRLFFARIVFNSEEKMIIFFVLIRAATDLIFICLYYYLGKSNFYTEMVNRFATNSSEIVTKITKLYFMELNYAELVFAYFFVLH